MCLKIVSETYEPPLKREGEGFKVMRKGKNIFGRPRVEGDFHEGRYKLGKWYQSSKGYINNSYPTGFHIFQLHAHAVAWSERSRVVVRVKYKDVVAYGEQAGQVVVARKMKILEVVS